jgi:hypothetical protein
MCHRFCFLQKKISPKAFGPHCVYQKNEGHNHTSVEAPRPASTDICPTPFQTFCLPVTEEDLQQPVYPKSTTTIHRALCASVRAGTVQVLVRQQ